MDLTLFINNEHRADDDLPARFNDHIEQVRVARQAGYNGVAVGNHLSFGSTAWFPPLETLMRLSAEADGMSLSTCMLVLPLYHPLHVVEQASLLGALYYGFFGVGLLASPSFFFGPDGLIPYFKEEAGPGGIFFARSFGAFMAACAYSHFTDGPSAAVVKYMAVAGALMMPQWALCTMDDEGHNTLLWKIHTPVQLGMIALLGKAGGLF